MSRLWVKPKGHLAPRVTVTSAILLAIMLVSSVWAMRSPRLTAVVVTGDLPVRSTPNLVTATVAQLSAGQIINLTGYRTADSRWIQIRLPGVAHGWVPAESMRTRFPIANLAVATLPGGRSTGGIGVVEAAHASVHIGAGSKQPTVAQLVRDERVELTGFRTGDGAWIQVALPEGQSGWVEAGSIASDYPLSALTPVEGAR